MHTMLQAIRQDDRARGRYHEPLGVDPIDRPRLQALQKAQQVRIGEAALQGLKRDLCEKRGSFRHPICVPCGLKGVIWVGLMRPTICVPTLGKTLYAENTSSQCVSVAA